MPAISFAPTIAVEVEPTVPLWVQTAKTGAARSHALSAAAAIATNHLLLHLPDAFLFLLELAQLFSERLHLGFAQRAAMTSFAVEKGELSAQPPHPDLQPFAHSVIHRSPPPSCPSDNSPPPAGISRLACRRRFGRFRRRLGMPSIAVARTSRHQAVDVAAPRAARMIARRMPTPASIVIVFRHCPAPIDQRSTRSLSALMHSRGAARTPAPAAFGPIHSRAAAPPGDRDRAPQRSHPRSHRHNARSGNATRPA